jgi:polyisoprenoid-binding protein YceI
MASPEQLASPTLEALLRDGTLTGSWTLNPARSEVRLNTRHTWGLLPLKGVLTVGAGSVDTKNKQRDKHLRSADFFDAKVSRAAAEVWLDAEVPVNRADFGLTWNCMGIAAMDSTIAVHAVFTRQ